MTIDYEGEDLLDLTAARTEALLTIGEAMRSLAAKGQDGRVVLEVRNCTGPVVRVEGTILMSDLQLRAASADAAR